MPARVRLGLSLCFGRLGIAADTGATRSNIGGAHSSWLGAIVQQQPASQVDLAEGPDCDPPCSSGRSSEQRTKRLIWRASRRNGVTNVVLCSRMDERRAPAMRRERSRLCKTAACGQQSSRAEIRTLCTFRRCRMQGAHLPRQRLSGPAPSLAGICVTPRLWLCRFQAGWTYVMNRTRTSNLGRYPLAVLYVTVAAKGLNERLSLSLHLSSPCCRCYTTVKSEHVVHLPA